MLIIPHYRQLADGYCLPACAQMVLSYWGIEQEQEALARQLQVIPRAGTPGSRLRLLESAELDVVYETGELSVLQTALAEGKPPIVLVHTRELPYWARGFAHAVVIVEMGEQQVTMLDPAWKGEPVSVTLGDFHLAWDEMGNLYGLIIRRNR